jgi:hypothetical protein
MKPNKRLMKKIAKNPFCIVLLMGFLIASCGSKKNLTSGSADMSRFSETTYLKTVVENAPEFEEFSAKMRLELMSGDESLSVGGSIRMKRDEAIQLSLVAAGIVEAARIELTPKRLLVLDRIGRRYVEVEYDNLPFFKQSKVDFNTLQALFWNEIFLPGVKHVTKGDIRNFDFTREEKHVTLSTEAGKRLSYSFLTAYAKGLLEESRIHVNLKEENDYQLNWTYAHFLALEGKPFPTRMDIALQGTKMPMKASFEFSRCDTKAEYTPLTIPKRYKQVAATDILKQLLTR